MSSLVSQILYKTIAFITSASHRSRITALLLLFSNPVYGVFLLNCNLNQFGSVLEYRIYFHRFTKLVSIPCMHMDATDRSSVWKLVWHFGIQPLSLFLCLLSTLYLIRCTQLCWASFESWFGFFSFCSHLSGGE